MSKTYVGVSVKLSQQVTTDLVTGALEQYKRTQQYVDYTDYFWVATNNNSVDIIMAPNAGYNSGCGLRDYAEFQPFLVGFIKCYLSMQGLGGREIQVATIAGTYGDQVYTNYKTGRQLAVDVLNDNISKSKWDMAHLAE